MKQRLLITGATGFTGIHLLKSLVKNSQYRVAIIKRNKSDISLLKPFLKRINVYNVNCDGSNIYSIMEKERPDIVIHLAGFFRAEHEIIDIDPMFTTNILFGTKLVDAMVRHGVTRLINTGTYWEYYDGGKTYNPVCLYAATKRAFENIVKFYIESYGMKVVTLKIFDIYGRNDHRVKLFNTLTNALNSNKPIDMSPADQYIDLLYIDDAVSAYEKAIDYVWKIGNKDNEVFFIGSGKTIKLKNVVRLFEKIAGKKLKINFGGRRYRRREVMFARANINKAKKLLNWKPKIQLEEGIRRILKGES